MNKRETKQIDELKELKKTVEELKQEVKERQELFERFEKEVNIFTDKFMTKEEKYAQVVEQIKHFKKEREELLVLLQAWEKKAHELKEKK